MPQRRPERETAASVLEGQAAGSGLAPCSPRQAEATPDVTPSSAPILRGQGEHLKAERAGTVTLNPGDPQHGEARAAERSEWTGEIPAVGQEGTWFLFVAGHRLT